MTPTKHTPGPWKVDPNFPGMVRIDDDPTSGILVGLAANARLIAAAPELLEALKEAMGELNDYRRLLVYDKEDVADLKSTISKAAAAIAKATGEAAS